MIVIKAEDGSIITDPKEIYIDKDLDGNLHLYADLSNTDRIKAVKLTVFNYSKNELGKMLEKLYQKMDTWLFMSDCPHYATSMNEILDMEKLDSKEASHD